MLGDRRVSAKLFSKIESFRVPKACITRRDGVDYVQRASGEEVPVLVVSQDGSFAFVQTYQGQPALKTGELLKK
jgi:hypothetical protein